MVTTHANIPGLSIIKLLTRIFVLKTPKLYNQHKVYI